MHQALRQVSRIRAPQEPCGAGTNIPVTDEAMEVAQGGGDLAKATAGIRTQVSCSTHAVSY